MNEPFLWTGSITFIVLLLGLDLFVFNRNTTVIKVKTALLWTGFWVLIAILFDAFIYLFISHTRAKEYITGYLVEQSLSMDNLFVFLLLFKYFQTPAAWQRKVLSYGIIGAVIFRAIFIFAGISLVNAFSFTSYILGGFLLFTAIKMLVSKDNEVHPDNNIVLRAFRKIIPVSPQYQGGRFFVKEGLKYFATPLLIVLIVVETTDIVFAFDSIPAIIGITHDRFIVFTSNIFAILGLRTLYFALAGIMDLFHYLHYGLSVILIFIGVKIIIQRVYDIDINISLMVVAGILVLSVLVSILFPKKSS